MVFVLCCMVVLKLVDGKGNLGSLYTHEPRVIDVSLSDPWQVELDGS